MKKQPKIETKFLLNVTRPYWFFYLLLVLASLVSTIFDAVSVGTLVAFLNNLQSQPEAGNAPAFLRWIINLLAPYPIEKQLFFAITLVIVAVLLKNVFAALSVKLGQWLTSKIMVDLRMRAMRLLMNVGIDFHRQSRVGDLVAQSMGFTTHINHISRQAVQLLVDVMNLFMLVGMLMMLSWKLTLITLVYGAIFGKLLAKYTGSLKRLGKELANRQRKMSAKVYESLGAIELIKSVSQEESQLKQLQRHIAGHQKLSYRMGFRRFLVNPFTEVAGIIGLGGLVFSAMYIYGMNLNLLLAKVVPFLYILNRIIPSLKMMNMKKAEIVSRWPFLQMFYDLLRTDDKPFVPDGHKAFAGLNRDICFRNVSFAYNGKGQLALNQADFVIPAGRTTAIIGQSGSGKSTIVNLLLRFYDPKQGQILIDGEPLPEFKLSTWRSRIGIVSQDIFLFNDTVFRNITFGLKDHVTEEQVREAVRKAGADVFIAELPQGFDTVLGERGTKLSGGQRQRISIARAILRNPEILILDEATSSLDTSTERLIHQAIIDLSRNHTMIIIAHRLSTIKNADQIIVLKDGEVIESGNSTQLYELKGEYYQLVNVR